MIKIKFPEDGGVSFEFPKKNRQQARCIERLNEIMAGRETCDLAVTLALGIAATNGPKTFNKALRYFNVA